MPRPAPTLYRVGARRATWRRTRRAPLPRRQPRGGGWRPRSGQKPFCAISTALSIALALLIVSSYSLAGTESATTPAPA